MLHPKLTSSHLRDFLPTFLATLAFFPGLLRAELCTVEAPGVDIIATDNGVIYASALRMSMTPVHIDMEGEARLQRDRQSVDAQEIRYFTETRSLMARGDVIYSSPDWSLSSSELFSQLDSQLLRASDSQFDLKIPGAANPRFPSRGHGSASLMIRDTAGVSHLDGTTYTTCANPDDGWQLGAGTLVLDPHEGLGTATDVTLRLGGVPVFYAPWFRFPIDDRRRSGFLVPVLGNSSQHGVELGVPWYWNIAPQADATLTPRYMSKRGLQMQSEWRYLTETGPWQLDNEYLYRDRERDDKRHYTRLRHQGGFTSGWLSSVDIARVSDDFYFEDFGNSYSLSSVTHLPSEASLSNSLRNEVFSHSTQIRVQQFQTLNGTEEPYRREPQVLFTLAPNQRTIGIQADIYSEWVRFDHDSLVTGRRFDLRPRLQRPFERSWGFARPSVSAWYTRYELDNAGTGEPESIERKLAVYSLDMGLYFDRISETGSQTLEPRLFLLYVPYEDQSAIPVFDSHRYDFSFAQLFRENRFSGADRVGDTRQATVALTSRWKNRQGYQFGSASIGQAYYLRDRRVSLDNVTVETSERSNLVAELVLTPTHQTAFRANVHWNPDQEDTDRSSFTLAHTTSGRTRINLAHYYRESDYEQVDLSMVSPLDTNWLLAARWQYSLLDDTRLDALLALEYESCCWSLRTALRNYEDSNNEQHSSVYVELVMKGLGKAGDNIGQQLERDILGFSDPYR